MSTQPTDLQARQEGANAGKNAGNALKKGVNTVQGLGNAIRDEINGFADSAGETVQGGSRSNQGPLHNANVDKAQVQDSRLPAQPQTQQGASGSNQGQLHNANVNDAPVHDPRMPALSQTQRENV
ncbi:hypothetical protein EJ08DRAFT_647843, partial [Tothia fuscella]